MNKSTFKSVQRFRRLAQFIQIFLMCEGFYYMYFQWMDKKRFYIKNTFICVSNMGLSLMGLEEHEGE